MSRLDSRRLRTALLAAAALAFAVPTLAHAGPEACLQPDPLDAAVCSLKEGGAVAQSVEGPATPVRDGVRTSTDAFRRTTQAGVPMVMDTCPAMEWPRLERSA